jgi:heme-degrading monooxygenase HmoA
MTAATILVTFRSRLKPGVEAEYAPVAARMDELAASMPGYIAHKSFIAEDGERVTLVEFESEETMRAWRDHPEHRGAQRLGRERFYAEFRLTVCRSVRETRFPG